MKPIIIVFISIISIISIILIYYDGFIETFDNKQNNYPVYEITDCTRGYCDYERNKMAKEYNKIRKNYKVNCNAKLLGYDNPYIYPYNYCLNNNDPIYKYKYPQWMRLLMLKGNKDFEFQGYII